MTKAVVLLSGGMDSSVVLYEAIAWHHASEVCALGIDYGQRHASEELTRAALIAAMAGVDYMRVRIDLGVFAALVNGDDKVISDPRDAAVPYRNSFFALRAATHALARGALQIWMGCCAADAEAFPDCRPEWASAMSALLDVGGRQGMHLVTPVIDRTKAQIVARARALGPGCVAACESSWSCYCPVGPKAQRQPCGECSACRARARGFAEDACSR